MGSKAEKSTSRRGRKLLALGLIGLGAAVFKATKRSAAQPPAPTPAPTPAPAPTDAVESEAIERLETEAPVVPGVEEAVATVPEPLAEPVLEAEAPVEAAVEPLAEPSSATADLQDIVEEPWGDAEVTPATEPPADSLSSFFDEVMTDTAERKLRKDR